jgi:plasmid stabilization system protein ParE
MPTVVVRPRALTDLAEIWAYIARQSADDSPDQADAFVELVDNKFQTLSRRPGMGRRRPELARVPRPLCLRSLQTQGGDFDLLSPDSHLSPRDQR